MNNTREALFRALADPTRRVLLESICREGEETVGALTRRANISQPAISKHLAVLKRAGLVRGRREGRMTRYSVNIRALAELIDWASKLGGGGTAFRGLESMIVHGHCVHCGRRAPERRKAGPL